MMSSHRFAFESVALECIPETDMTNAFLIEKIEEGLEALKGPLADGAKIVNIECKDITGLNGYVSCIYKYTIELALPKEKEERGDVSSLSVILKLFSEKRIYALLKVFAGAGAGDALEGEKGLREMASRLSAVHNRECDVYERIGNLGLVPMPTVYYLQRLDAEAKISGLIVMEDLTASTYLDRMEEGLSRAKVENIVRYLAILHSYTYKMGEASSDWLAFFPELLSYYRIYENDFGGERMMEEMIRAALVSNPQAADSLRKLKKVITNKDFMKLACHTAATENGVPLVMVHGDLWTNNILWKKTEDGRELDEPAAFIDWQLTFAGNPMADIARVLMCSEADVRRGLDDSILPLYYDEVCRLMAEDGDGKRPSFTVANLRPAFEYMLVNQAALFAFIVTFFEKMWGPPPGTTLSEEEQAELNYKLERLKRRQVEVSKDAVEILERIAPDWIDYSGE